MCRRVPVLGAHLCAQPPHIQGLMMLLPVLLQLCMPDVHQTVLHGAERVHRSGHKRHDSKAVPSPLTPMSREMNFGSPLASCASSSAHI